MASPILKALSAELKTTNDDLNKESILVFVLHPTNDGKRYAEKTFDGGDKNGGGTSDGQTKVFDFDLNTTTLTRDEINHNFSIDVIINPDRTEHDKYEGLLTLSFIFDDGNHYGFSMEIKIATYGGMSNQTGKRVDFPGI